MRQFLPQFVQADITTLQRERGILPNALDQSVLQVITVLMALPATSTTLARLGFIVQLVP